VTADGARPNAPAPEAGWRGMAMDRVGEDGGRLAGERWGGKEFIPISLPSRTP